MGTTATSTFPAEQAAMPTRLSVATFRQGPTILHIAARCHALPSAANVDDLQAGCRAGFSLTCA